MSIESPIAVIIAAYNSQGTIGDAVRSVLAQPEAGEVIVVDDASGDDTVEAAAKAAGGDPRLVVLRQDRNRGPSAARNLAIASSTSPLIGVLDADDLLMPGRFARILAERDWDFCADNIVFFSSKHEIGQVPDDPAPDHPAAIDLTFEQFVAGNTPSYRRPRGELGFLKPVFRRDFLKRHGLAYRERCRLGEDFLLYAEALAHGARFKVLSTCGYAAMVRNDSLSGQHSLEDLENLYAAERELLDRLRLAPPQEAALRTHAARTLRRCVHRKALLGKASRGWTHGLLTALQHPATLVDIARDRFARPSPTGETPRKLLSSEQFRHWSA